MNVENIGVISNMNICFILGGFTSNGGIGRVVSILVNGLCKDANLNIYTISFYDTKMPNLYKIDKRVQQNYLFESRINMSKGILKGGILKLKRFLYNNNIDILVACGALYFPISILSCKGTQTKCICWEHSNIYTTDDHNFQRFCRYFGAKFSDYVVTLTKRDETDYINRYHITKIKQIYNPVDKNLNDNSYEYDSKSKKIISVGRLTPPKNYSTLIDIASVILTKYDDWTWDIYGNGELFNDLQRKINDYGLQDKLKLKGQVNNIYELYHKYSFLVMTSTREGFPMVLIEAAANFLPLVSFDIVTGPNEIIKHGVNGYLIEPFSIDLMIQHIEKLILEEETRIKMAENSKRISGNFSFDFIINEWKVLFQLIKDRKD